MLLSSSAWFLPASDKTILIAILFLVNTLFSLDAFQPSIMSWRRTQHRKSIHPKLLQKSLGLLVVSSQKDEDWLGSSSEDLDLEIDTFLNPPDGITRSDGGRVVFPRPFYHDLDPGETVEAALCALRYEGDAVLFQNFCVPIARGEEFVPQSDPWREILRGAITPDMLVHRLRASQVFAGLLDWEKMDVTEGAALQTAAGPLQDKDVAFCNAALYFGRGLEPCLIQFTLRRIGGVWLIYSARQSRMELFMHLSNDWA